MRLITMRTVREFAFRHSHIGDAVFAWAKGVRAARWKTMEDLRRDRPGAVAIDANTVVFKRLAGNQVRIVANIDWERAVVYVKFIGTHAEYDRVDVRSFRYL